MKWQCRLAPSLGGGFDGTPNQAWGTVDYKDDQAPTVFFGLYGLPDFYNLWRHRGKKCILWCGSDIRHFVNGYWLEEEGIIKIDPKPLAEWINKNCESWVENEIEYNALKELGIESQICPSFLGDVTKFEISYQWSKRPKLYTSVSGDDFKLYGWDKINKLSAENLNIEFHLYGNKEPFIIDPFNEEEPSNVIIHGRVPKEQMNEEIKDMQGALRLVEFEGFSEIIAKSLLMGQWPVSLIKYPHTLSVENIDMLKLAKEPNMGGREWLLSVVNKFPWNLKK